MKRLISVIVLATGTAAQLQIQTKTLDNDLTGTVPVADPEPPPISTETLSFQTATPEATHTIKVGEGGRNAFNPSQTTAEVGDVLEFMFFPTDHWVIRADFEYPCIPYEYTASNRQGFSSGAQPVGSITDNAPRFRVVVNDTEPIFYYCGAPGSCEDYQMVGVVNPTINETFVAHRDKAEQVHFQLRPGEPWPAEEGPPPDDEATPDGEDETPPEEIETPSSSDSGGETFSTATIAGTAAGAVALVALAAAGCFFFGRRDGRFRKKRKQARQAETDEPLSPRGSPGNGPPELPAHSPISPFRGPSMHEQSPHGNPGSPGFNQGPHPYYQMHGPSPTSLAGHPGVPYAFQGSPNGMWNGEFNGTIGSHMDPQLTVAIPEAMSRAKTPPVELPSSQDPGNSPLPAYSEAPRPASWTPRDEYGYRPSKPAL